MILKKGVNSLGFLRIKVVLRAAKGRTPAAKKFVIYLFHLYSEVAHFRGELSELNIWGRALNAEELKKITQTCESPHPTPDVLNWAKVTSNMLNGKNYKTNVKQLCRYTNETTFFYKLIPYTQNQDEALHTCQILSSQLAYPKIIEDYQSWNSELFLVFLISYS